MTRRHTHMLQRNAGYTLVEMLITVSIFALAFVTIGAIFIGFTAAQSRATTAQRLLNEGGFILEAVTREIRINAIDYACTAANPVTNHAYLCLKSLDGRSVHFRFNNFSGSGVVQSCVDYDDAPCTLANQWVDMNPSTLRITKFEFHTYPTSNPHNANQGSSQVFQPITTMVMSIEAGTGRAMQRYDLQTAASSRVYSF
ncbi:MAG: type II secretion system protein [Candidatus Komeilibacteria bacterium]|nr:type II secretion system protein [Candidatus Komeilibacteria bacterium]